MIYDNVSISWDKRSDLPKLYLIFRYIDNCIGSQYSTGRDYLYSEVVVSVGRIQSDYQKMFLEKINDSLIDFFCSEIYFPRDGSPCSEVRLCKYDELNVEQKYREVRSRKIENLSACIQEVKDELEELEKTCFRERNDIGIQTNIIPVVSDSPAIPAAVASVPFSGDSPAVPASVPVADVPAVIPDVIPDYSSFVSSVASRERVTSKTVEVKQPEDEHLKVLKRIDKRLENIENGVQQTANNTESIDRKFPGKITRVKDIPPYNPTDKRWVKATRYSEITGVERASLDSERFRVKEENIAPDKNSGIHGEHCWRRVNGTIFYLVYQPKYLDWL